VTDIFTAAVASVLRINKTPEKTGIWRARAYMKYLQAAEEQATPSDNIINRSEMINRRIWQRVWQNRKQRSNENNGGGSSASSSA
jgi:hypothetical protein